MGHQGPQADPVVLQGTTEGDVHGASIQQAAQVIEPAASPDQPVSGLPSFLVPGSYAVSNHPHGTLPLSQGTNSPSPLKLSLLTLSKSPNSRQTQSSQAHPGSKSPMDRTPLGDKSNTPPDQPAAAAGAGDESEAKAAPNSSQSQHSLPGQTTSQNAEEGPINSEQQGHLHMADQGVRGASVQLPILAALPGQGPSQRQLDAAPKQPPQGLQDDLPKCAAPGDVDLGPACPPTQLVLLPATQVVAPTQAVLPAVDDEDGDGLAEGEGYRSSKCPDAGLTVQLLVQRHAADCTPSKVQGQAKEALGTAPPTSLPAAAPSLMEVPLARVIHSEGDLGFQQLNHPPSNSPNQADTEGKGREILEQEAVCQLDKAAPAAECDPAAAGDPEPVAESLHDTGFHPAAPAAHAAEVSAQLLQSSVRLERAEDAVAGHCQAQCLQQQQQQPATSRRLHEPADELVVAEAEQRMRQLMCGESATPMTLGSDATACTDGSALTETEAVTQYQSLLGEDAAAQEAVIEHARAWAAGEPTGALKSLVTNEVVSTVGRAFLGRDSKSMRASFISTCLRILWRELRRHGLDGFCYEGGECEDSGVRLVLDPEGEAEVEGFLCSEAEVEHRRQQLATKHMLSRASILRRRSSAGTANLATEGSPPSGQVKRSAQHSTPGSVKPRAAAKVAAGGAEAETHQEGQQNQHTQGLGGLEAARTSQQEPSRRALMVPEVRCLVVAADAQPRLAASAAAPPAAVFEAPRRPIEALEDAGAAELDIHPTLVSPPRPLHPPRAQPADGPSQLDIPPTQLTVQPVPLKPAEPDETSKPGLAAPTAAAAATQAGPSQLQVPCTLLTAPPQPSAGQTHPEPTLAANGPAAAPSGTAPAAVGQAGTTQAAGDPFDDLFASQQMSEPSLLPKTKAQVHFAGSWWFGTSTAQEQGNTTLQTNAAAQPAAPAVQQAAVGGSGEEQPGEEPQQAQHQVGIVCSMVPDTPPDATPSGSKPAQRQDVLAGNSPPAVPPACSPAAPTAAAGDTTAVVAAAGRAAERQQMQRGPAGAMPVPDSEDPTACGAQPAQQQCASAKDGAGPATQDPVASQAVGEADLRSALDAVGRISNDFPATQEVMGAASAPAAHQPLSMEPVATRQHLAAGTILPPAVQLETAVGPQGEAVVEQTAVAPPLTGHTKRRWKQGQAQQGEASDPSGAEGSPSLAGVARRGDRKSSGRGAKAAQGDKSKQQVRREQRQDQRARQMAPLGVPRPDLAASGGLIFVHKSPGTATARRLSAGAAGGVLPPISRSPEVAPASEQPAMQVQRASHAEARTGQAAVGRSAQAAAGLHSSGLQDGDLFATQLHFLHPARVRALCERDDGAAAPAIGQPAASPSLYNAGRADPFRFPSDGQSGGRAAPDQRQPGPLVAVRAGPHGAAAHHRNTASLNELAKTAPSVPEPEAEEPEDGEAAGAGVPARQEQAQRGQLAQEESEEQQLLIIHGPHPLVQTMPQGDGADAAWMQRKLAAAAQQQGKQQPEEGKPAGVRPTRQIKPPARFRDSLQKAEDPAPTGVIGDEPGQRQEEEAEDVEQHDGLAKGRKRSTAAADGIATVAKRWRSSLAAAGGEGDRTPAGISAAGAAGAPNAAAVPASEDQLLAQYMASYKLGCSKCRHSSNGCGKCRADRDEIIQSAIKAGMSVFPPALQGSSSPGYRRKSAGAAAAAGALLSASPSPKLAGKRQQRVEAAAEAEAADQLEQGRRRLSGRQRRDELASGAGAASADNEEPPLSQDMGGRHKRAKAGSTVAGAAQQGAGGRQGTGAEASPAGVRRQRVFEGARFLVTGFSDCPDRKRELVGLVTKHGGTLLADVPRPGPQGRRHSMGGRGEGISFVLCDNKLRTPKFLYAVIRGIPIVKPCWVESCVAAGSQVPPRAQHLAYATGPVPGCEAEDRPPAFAGVRVYLHGARSITDPFGQLLQHAGAVIVSCIEAAVPAAGRAGRLPAQTEAACDLLLLDADEEGDASTRGTVSSLQRLARRLHIPIHDREWAIRVLLEGRLPDDFPLIQQQRQHQEQQLEHGEAGTPTPRTRKPAASPAPGAATLAADPETRARGNQGPRSSRKLTSSRAGAQEQPPQQQPEADQEGNAAHAGPAAAPPALHARSASGEVHASSLQWRGRASAGRRHSSIEAPVLQQVTAGQRPPLQPGNTPPAQALQAPCPQQYHEELQRLQYQLPQQQQQHTPQQQQPQLPACLAWLGGPQPAPPDLPNTSVRQYYAAFVKDAAEVRLGDCVELAPAPGEEMPRLALIQALWAELTPDGRERMLARCRRFYRPQETTRKILRRSLPHEVYLSDHVEDRVLLAAVLGRCSVLAEEPEQLLPNTYVCEFKYDCNTTALLPLDNGQEWRCC